MPLRLRRQKSNKRMWLKKLVDLIERISHPPSRVINYAGFGFLLTLMLLVVVHVAGRYLFNLPIPGAVELIQFLMSFVVFWGFGYCAVQRGNVSVDLFVTWLPRRAQGIIDALVCLLSIGIVSLIAWQGAVQAKSLWHSGHVSGVLHIPYFPFLIVLVIGCAVFDLVLVANFFESMHGALKK